jgi:hypothetical protein
VVLEIQATSRPRPDKQPDILDGSARLTQLVAEVFRVCKVVGSLGEESAFIGVVPDLRKQIAYNLAMDIGQTNVASAKAITPGILHVDCRSSSSF